MYFWKTEMFSNYFCSVFRVKQEEISFKGNCKNLLHTHRKKTPLRVSAFIAFLHNSPKVPELQSFEINSGTLTYFKKYWIILVTAYFLWSIEGVVVKKRRPEQGKWGWPLTYVFVFDIHTREDYMLEFSSHFKYTVLSEHLLC